MTFDPILACVLAGVLGVALGAVVVLLVRTRREVGAEAQSSRTRHYELCEGFSELAAANAALRQQLEDIAARVEQAGRAPLVVPATSGGGRAYELAARLAASGAAAGELVTSCGLTPAEAELAVLVHGTRRRAAATH